VREEMASKQTKGIVEAYQSIRERGGIAFPDAMVKAWLAERGVRVPVGRAPTTP
jgi:hypothetical protein